MRPLYIFDLDGTLALTEHRQHLLQQLPAPDWHAFFAACVGDKPNVPVIDTMYSLMRRATVQIWSGRSDEVRPQTLSWLVHNTPLGMFEAESMLRMRAAGDFTPDEVLKKRWLDELEDYDRQRLVAVFDDRDKVVAMWRAAGVPCFQVAPGAF